MEVDEWKKQMQAGAEVSDPIRKHLILEEIKGAEQTADGLKVPFIISTGALLNEQPRERNISWP